MTEHTIIQLVNDLEIYRKLKKCLQIWWILPLYEYQRYKAAKLLQPVSMHSPPPPSTLFQSLNIQNGPKWLRISIKVKWLNSWLEFVNTTMNLKKTKMADRPSLLWTPVILFFSTPKFWKCQQIIELGEKVK